MKKILAIALAVLLGLVFTAPAQAAAPTVKVAALGDSYGSGVGGGSYIGGTDTPGGCWQSMNGPTQQVVHTLLTQGKSVELTNFTCSGDTIGDVRAHQMGALMSDTTLVTLWVGGNDVGFGALVNQCLTSACSGAPIRAAELALVPMSANLTRLLDQIHNRSPRAQVILGGYGQPMTGGPNGLAAVDPICDLSLFDLTERKDAQEFAAALDFTLRSVAGLARLRGQDVKFVSPFKSSSVKIEGSRLKFTGTLRPEFEKRSLCSDEPQLYRGFDAVAGPPIGDPAGPLAVMHMEAEGYAKMAGLVLSTIQ